MLALKWDTLGTWRDEQHRDRSYPQHRGLVGGCWWCSPFSLQPGPTALHCKQWLRLRAGELKGLQNLAKPDWSLLFYPALFYRSGASLKLILSKFGVSNCCFRGFALNLYNSPVPEVMETRWRRFTVCLPSPKWLWQQDILFSASK